MPLSRRITTIRDPATSSPANTKYQGFGGFPGPLTIAGTAVKRMAPNAYSRLERKITLPRTMTLNGPISHDESGRAILGQTVPWLNFDGLVVGRNSNFDTKSLSDEQVEQIGGTEYRALRLLSYLVPIVRSRACLDVHSVHGQSLTNRCVVFRDHPPTVLYRLRPMAFHD